MRRLIALLMVASICWLGLAAPAAGDTFQTTRLDDPAAAKCTPTNCSLRGAISAANGHAGPDKVVVGEGTFELTLPETPQNDNAGGDLDVKGEVRITGMGSSLTTVDANGGSRVFSLLRDPQKSLERMNITGGNAQLGGGILVGPPETNFSPAEHKLRNLVIQGNVATLHGGGIYGSLQRMKLSRTTITGNSAANGGGGMYLGAAATLGSGSPPVKIHSSTFSGNTAGIGAGLYLDGANSGDAVFDPRASTLNSTFAFNIATVSGGGISLILGAELAAEHTTVAYNGADSDSSGGGDGGGVYQSTDAYLSLRWSLVKENSVGSSGDGPQCAGAITFIGVITPQGTPGLCTFEGGSVIQGEVPANIGSLTNNGGPTQTIAILQNSLANGWRDDSFCPPKDQRGQPRPLNECDVGAYERP
ncbi:MAG: choice-of-anchor Q domain-containing protein [Solirubrobacterales bacterium]